MSDFRSEQLKELISVVRKAAKLDKCRFEFYMHGETKPWSSKVNRNVERVLVLLEELIKRDYSLAYEVKDTQKMSSKQVKQAYDSSAHWASNPKRPYGISRMIYDIFVGGEAGDLFGKEIPAMILYDVTGNILFVLPHVVKGDRFSLKCMHACVNKAQTNSLMSALSYILFNLASPFPV